MPVGYDRSRSPLSVLGLHLGNVGQDIPVGDNPTIASAFINIFVKVHDNYLAMDFRTPERVHLAQKPWWIDLTLYVFEHFDEDLRIGLHKVVRATCYGIEVNMPTFYAIFELCCPTSGNFFTPVGELGLVLHEI